MAPSTSPCYDLALMSDVNLNDFFDLKGKFAVVYFLFHDLGILYFPKI